MAEQIYMTDEIEIVHSAEVFKPSHIPPHILAHGIF